MNCVWFNNFFLLCLCPCLWNSNVFLFFLMCFFLLLGKYWSIRRVKKIFLCFCLLREIVGNCCNFFLIWWNSPVAHLCKSSILQSYSLHSLPISWSIISLIIIIGRKSCQYQPPFVCNLILTMAWVTPNFQVTHLSSLQTNRSVFAILISFLKFNFQST